MKNSLKPFPRVSQFIIKPLTIDPMRTLYNHLFSKVLVIVSCHPNLKGLDL